MSHLFLNETRIHEILELARPVPRDFALLHMAACTAMRSSDLLNIKIKHMFDNDGDIIRVLRLKMIKTKKWIERPLRDDCRAAVRNWLGSRNDKNSWLFCALKPDRDANQPLHRVSYRRIIRRYLKVLYHESALQGCATHTLRRSIAKVVYKKTGEIAVAQSLLGHTSPAPTIRYLDPKEIKETADKVVLELGY